jgi:hypothetical protein
VRYFAAQALGNICCDPQLVAPGLLMMIRREKDVTPSSPSLAAAIALSKLGTTYPEEVIPLLISELPSETNLLKSAVPRLGVNSSTTGLQENSNVSREINMIDLVFIFISI